MDLIYTDGKRIDQGVLSAYAFDLSFGGSENDFELTLGASEPSLDFGAFIYIEGTEYGGIIDGKNTNSNSDTITYTGRTWHGLLNSKVIQPDAGADYLILSGEANELLGVLIDRLDLGALFQANTTASDINIKTYKFKRYDLAYDAIADMLGDNDAKLKITWDNRTVILSAEPIVDYTEAPVDGDMASLKVERHANKVNHLICLGQGNLAEREVIHLYANQFGGIGDSPSFTGLDEYAATYENTNAESSDILRSEGVKKLKELWGTDTAEMTLYESDELVYDIGDIVGVDDIKSGNSVEATVTQKIVKINNGVIKIEYKTGG